MIIKKRHIWLSFACPTPSRKVVQNTAVAWWKGASLYLTTVTWKFIVRRIENLKIFVSGEGGEGEEPPEGIQEDEDGDEEDDDISRHSSEATETILDSRLASPITVLHPENCNTHPIDLANSELLSKR